MNNYKEPTGVVIGFICNGSIPVKWAYHMREFEKTLPGGLLWTTIYTIGDFSKDKTKSYASLRTEVVERAIELNYKYILFIDSDVFPDAEALTKLMSVKADIVSGVYWMKSKVEQPVIYHKIGDGAIWDIQYDKVIDIGGAGLGLCLINLDVFRTMKQKGIPYFKQNWVYDMDDGRKMQVNIGEDHWMFHQAKQLGFSIKCHMGVLAPHYDINSDTFYPLNNKINQIKHDSQNFDITIDDKKPISVFWNTNNVPINGNSLDEKPIAGSEEALISMANEFANDNYNTIVLCNCDKEGNYNGVQYFHYSKVNVIMKHLEQFGVDVFISSRDMTPFIGGRPPAKHTMLWLHDMPQPNTIDFDNIDNIDKLVFVSKFQKKAYKDYYKKQLLGAIGKKFNDKSTIIPNGLNDKFKQVMEIKRIKGKCFYASTPYRGLDVLLNCWIDIKKAVPNAQLHIFSSMSIYNQQESQETAKLFELAKKMQKYDVFVIGSIDRDRLAYEMKSSEVLLYPNTFIETFCNVVNEALYSGCKVVTSNQGALPEFTKKGEIFTINGDPYSDKYINHFTKTAIDVLKNKITNKKNKNYTITDWKYSYKLLKSKLK